MIRVICRWWKDWITMVAYILMMSIGWDACKNAGI
jgi:hypothetical protein